MMWVVGMIQIAPVPEPCFRSVRRQRGVIMRLARDDLEEYSSYRRLTNGGHLYPIGGLCAWFVCYHDAVQQIMI